MDDANSPLIACVADAVCRNQSPGSARVLDVGCGQGALLAALAARGWSGCGLERAPGEAVQSVARFALAGRAEQLPFKDCSFPVVVLRHVPHHLENLSASVSYTHLTLPTIYSV